ncbi:MAG: hypothetical protein ABIQ18_27100 [Umezawaea sp.]
MTAPGGPSQPFTGQDMQILVEMYEAKPVPGRPRATPWTWAALDNNTAAALSRLIDQWVHYYNRVHAVTPKELVPPCWSSHHGLAHRLAVMAWAYYYAHHDPAATPFMAADYHARYLSGFRGDLDRLLGRDPMACRSGDHPKTWRSTTDEQADQYSTVDATREVSNLMAHHFGFLP